MEATSCADLNPNHNQDDAQIINGGPHSNNSEKLEKRKIKMFTTEEFLVLENAFAENQFLTREKYLHLSEILHINTNRIKHWFQNRRTKEKNSARNIAGAAKHDAGDIDNAVPASFTARGTVVTRSSSRTRSAARTTRVFQGRRAAHGIPGSRAGGSSNVHGDTNGGDGIVGAGGSLGVGPCAGRPAAVGRQIARSPWTPRQQPYFVPGRARDGRFAPVPFTAFDYYPFANTLRYFDFS